MRKSKFNKEQIIGILREAEGDTPVKAVCAKLETGSVFERLVIKEIIHIYFIREASLVSRAG